MRYFLAVAALVAGSAFAVDYDNYPEIYTSVADKYLFLFESNIRPDILAGYLASAAETAVRVNEHGGNYDARKLKKFLKFMDSLPIKPNDPAEYKKMLSDTKKALDRL